MIKNKTNEIDEILEKLEKATAIIFSGFCEYHKELPPSTDLSMCEGCKKHYDEHISLFKQSLTSYGNTQYQKGRDVAVDYIWKRTKKVGILKEENIQFYGDQLSAIFENARRTLK